MLLSRLLVDGDETELQEAYEWGRSALDRGVTLLEVVAAHNAALGRITDATSTRDEVRGAVDSAAGIVRELLAPYEMAHRGFREANAALMEVNRRLEQSIKDRDIARLEAEAANRAKSEFLSRMSHELRTPLNSILGFAQLLEARDFPPKVGESATIIRKAGNHLLSLINEVLDIAKIESGHFSISIEPVPIADLVKEVADLIRPLSEQQRVRLEVVPVAAGIHVRADYQRLRQVLMNLLSNAIKYNREGGSVMVSVSTVAIGARVEVTDTGRGIPEFRLQRMFIPFDRLGAENSSVEGTGLGLVLAKKLVEAMGGELGVVSVVGAGSTFWLELPTSESRATLDVADALRSTESSSTTIGTILYVEDNTSNVTLIEDILRLRPRVDLISASRGRLGLELALSIRPDLILLDLHLPDIHGLEVLRILCTDPRTSSIPVVILSADATPAQLTQLRASGALDYLTKPFIVERLLALIDQCLRGDTVPPVPPE